MIKLLFKVAMFGFFLILVYYIGDYFISLLRNYLPSSSFTMALACQVGILQGVNIFISIVVTSFVVKSILSYIEGL